MDVARAAFGSPSLLAPGGATDGTEDNTGIAQDFNNFLSLLTAQLQNQDPLEPTDSSEFTRQIVSFAGVEQQLRVNDNLEDLQAVTAAGNKLSAAGFLGHSALVEGNKIIHTNEGGLWEYGFLEPVQEVELRVLNSDEELVYHGEGSTLPGLHIFEWDGKSTDGGDLDPGTYELRITGINADGFIQKPSIFTVNKITSVDTAAGEEPLYTVGAQNVTADEILKLISDDEI